MMNSRRSASRRRKVLIGLVIGLVAIEMLPRSVTAQTSPAGDPTPPTTQSAVTATTTTTPNGVRTDVNTKQPSWLYPQDRGKPQKQLLDPSALQAPLPTDKVLGAVGGLAHLPSLAMLPQLDPHSLLPDLGHALPKLPSGLLGKQLGGTLDLLDHLPKAIGDTAGALSSAIQGSGTRFGITRYVDAGDTERPRNRQERFAPDAVPVSTDPQAALTALNAALAVNASGSTPIALVGEVQFQSVATPVAQPIALPFTVLPGDLVLCWYDMGGAISDIALTDLGTTRPPVIYSTLLSSPWVKAYVAPPSSTVDPNSQGAVISATLLPNLGGGPAPVAAYDMTFVDYRSVNGIVQTAAASSPNGAPSVVVSLPIAPRANDVTVAGATGSDIAMSPTPVGFTPRTVDDPVVGDNTGFASQGTAVFDNLGGPYVISAGLVELAGSAISVPPVPPSPSPVPSSLPSPPPTPGPLPDPGGLIPPPGQQPIFFQLITQSGITQTFDLPLCVPASIDIASTNPATPTTIVSLCPIPLGLTTQAQSGKIVAPPLDQPAQLYLSISRIPGTCGCSARFAATYTVPSTSGQGFTIQYGVDTTATNRQYPDNIVLGDASDYNPVTNTAATHVTMGWSMDGPVDQISTGAGGIGSMAVNGLPAGSGSLQVSADNGRYTAQLADTNPFPPGVSPSVQLIADSLGSSGNGNSGQVLWTNVPQDFTFNMQPTFQGDEPDALSYDGTQAPQANNAFATEFDLYGGGVLTGLVKQSGFGQSLSEQIQISRDNNNNIVGTDVQGNPGAASTLQLAGYRGAQLTAFEELVGLQAASSDVSLQFAGTGSTAQTGFSAKVTSGPAMIGAGMYLNPDGSLSSQLQGSLALTSSSVTPPIAIGPGALYTVTADGVAPTFTLDITDTASGQQAGQPGVGQFSAQGTAGTAETAAHMRIDAPADPNHHVTLVVNHLGPDFAFKVTPHGTLAAPTGAEIFDQNVGQGLGIVPNEFKEVYLTQNQGQGWTPEATFVIERAGSDRTGAITAAGQTVDEVDPPYTTDLTFDLQQTEGTCNGALVIQGDDGDASIGSVTFTSAGKTIQIANEFVVGKWNANVTFHGAAKNTCDQYTFDLQQDGGSNPAGQVTASGPAAFQLLGTAIDTGVVTLQGLDSHTVVSTSINPQASKGMSGLAISGTNTSTNPNLQLHLDGYSQGILAAAVNVSAANMPAPHTGTVATITATNVPPVFGLDVEHGETGTQAREFTLSSSNGADAPDEQVTAQVALPPDNGILTSTGVVQMVMRSFDHQSKLDIQLTPTGQSLSGDISIANATPSSTPTNPSQVVSVAVNDPWGDAVYDLLLTGPSGDATGLPTSSSLGTIIWQNMPPNYHLKVMHAATGTSSIDGVGSEEGAVDITDPTSDPNSLLTLQDNSDSATMVVSGSGPGLSLDVKANWATAQYAKLEVTGTLPVDSSSFNYLQLYQLFPYNQYNNKVYTVYRNGSPAVWEDDNGADLIVVPVDGQKSYQLTAEVSGTHATLNTASDVPDWHLSLAQYYQTSGVTALQPCATSGINYPCTMVNEYHIPTASDLKALLPTSANATATLGYTGTDNNMNLQIQSLVPVWQANIQINGVPSGLNIAGTLDMNSGVSFLATAGGTPMPNIYLSGAAIPMSMTQLQSCSMSGSDLGLSFPASAATLDATIEPDLYYTGLVTFQLQPGLTRVLVQPVKAKCGVFTGLEGVRVDGDSNANLGIGLTLSLQQPPNSVTNQDSLVWSWTLDMPGEVNVLTDGDGFYWTEGPGGNGADAWTSSYTWEALQNDATTKYGGSGCGAGYVPDQGGWHWSPWNTVPFSPTFPEVNNGVVVCGGHVAYYQLNPQGVLFEHCSDWGQLFTCPAGTNSSATNRYSWAAGKLITSDWILAAAMKDGYANGSDPGQLWSK